MIWTLPPVLLFCPADRPDRYVKAADRAPAVILDLEDAVHVDDKAAARTAMVQNPLDPARTVVRVNPVGTEQHDADLQALADTDYTMLMLAKAEGTDGFDVLRDYQLIALCETAAGVLAAAELAAHGSVIGLMWGAEDLVASLGGTSSRTADGVYRDVARHARSWVLIAAGAHQKAAIDAVHVAIDDLDGLAIEARDAAGSGFSSSACIHPGQVEVILGAYRPSQAELEWARAVMAEAAGQSGAFRYGGNMIDEPVLRRAANLLRRA